MSKKKLLEDFEAGIFAWSFLNQLLHNVMHNFHEAGHFLFRKVFTLREVTVEVRELLQNCDLCTLLHRAVKFLYDPCVVKP